MGDGRERETRMILKVLTTSVTTNKQYDLSEIVGDVVWTTGLDSQPGTFVFTMLTDPSVFLQAGDIIECHADNKKLFKGKVFRRQKDKEAKWQVTAYDNMRYLKNEDTLLFDASSSSTRFKKICQTQNVPYKILQASTYNCTPVIEDKHTYFAMLQSAFDETRQGFGLRYAVWDNFGTLEHFDLNAKITKLVIGDESLLLNYDYEASIDEAYNAVKVMREDKDKNKREIYSAKHDGNIAKWGRLQLVETISDADLNSSQLQKQANDLLKAHNVEAKTLTLEAVGSLDIRAGNSFILRLADLQKDGVGKDSLALVTKCRHALGSAHVMDLEVEVIA